MFLALELQNVCLLLRVRFGIWVDIDFFFLTCVAERDSGHERSKGPEVASQLGCEGWRRTV